MKLYIHYWDGEFRKAFHFPQFDTTFYEKWPRFTRINPYSFKFRDKNPLYKIMGAPSVFLCSTKNLAKLMKE